jgi:hypothetical protein
VTDSASRGQTALRRAFARAWPLLFLIAPATLLAPAVGRHRLPGLPGEPLFATLVQGAQTKRWLLGEDAWGVTGLIGGNYQHYWPAQLGVGGPLALLELVLSEPLAYGLLLLVALWLAGFGPALLARRVLGARPTAAWVVAGLAVQLAPPVLRCAWEGQLAVLAVGPLCLALAARRGWASGLWGLSVGGMGALTALVVALGAALTRRPWALTASLPPLLLFALLCGYLHSTPLPGSTTEPTVQSFVPGYVSVEGAVFPEAPARVGPSQARAGGSGWSSLPARIHGGPVALFGCLLGLAWRRSRPWALAGLAALGLLHLGLGPLPPPGVEAQAPEPWMRSLLSRLPGGAGPPELLVPVLLAAGLGWAALVRWRREASALALALILWTSPLLPLGRLPVTNLPPLPAAAALVSLEPGAVVLLPAVASPFRQKGAGDAELMHLASRLGRPLPLDSELSEVALIARIARVVDQPVHIGAAPVIWSSVHGAPGDMSPEASALLVDTEAYTPSQLAMLRTELQRLFGPPLTEDDRWLLWSL